jgi:signal transduction histidine kinase
MTDGDDESRALHTLGRLTRGALHEIANPLVALVGTAELALGEVEPGSKLHDRIALTRRTGTEIAEIVKALQAFVRQQGEPPAEVSVGEAAADAIALVSRVMPIHDRELTTSGDARVVAAPGELRRQLVELLLDALEREGAGAIELTVSESAVSATGGGEVRL